MFKSIYTKVISNIQISLGGSYFVLPKELIHPRKGLTNIQNIDDNECLKWYLVRYLHPVDHNPKRITKADQDFPKKLNFKDIKFPVKIKNIHKIEKTNAIGISVFGYENKEKHTVYVSKKYVKKNILIYY